MKMKNLLKTLLLVLPFFLSSCKKEKYGCMDITALNYDPKANVHSSYLCQYNQTYNTGDLVVNVRDGQGNSVIGWDVYLYNNEADFNNYLYSEKKKTNNSGQVTFENLSPGVYWVDCDYKTVAGNTVTVKGKGSVSAGYETTITIKP